VKERQRKRDGGQREGRNRAEETKEERRRESGKEKYEHELEPDHVQGHGADKDNDRTGTRT
jgi:hypothetical protein